MRPWLYALLRTRKIAHPGICDNCAVEIHGHCLQAWEVYLEPTKCKCSCRRFVKISNLILWQWQPSLMSESYVKQGWSKKHWDDELLIRRLAISYRNGDPVPPISIHRDETEVREFGLSDKGLRQFENGKWFVDDGFHRIYGRRRAGFDDIEAEFH